MKKIILVTLLLLLVASPCLATDFWWHTPSKWGDALYNVQIDVSGNLYCSNWTPSMPMATDSLRNAITKTASQFRTLIGLDNLTIDASGNITATKFPYLTSGYFPYVSDSSGTLADSYARQDASGNFHINGEAQRSIGLARRTASGNGNNLIVQGGSCLVGATNCTGGQVQIRPGENTGDKMSSVRIEGFTRDVSGNTSNTSNTRLMVPSERLLEDNTATSLFKVEDTSGSIAGGSFTFSITVTDASGQMQGKAGIVNYVGYNAGGVYTSQIAEASGTVVVDSSGTLALTWSITPAGTADCLLTNGFCPTISADTNLIAPYVIRFYYVLANGSRGTITQY